MEGWQTESISSWGTIQLISFNFRVFPHSYLYLESHHKNPCNPGFGNFPFAYLWYLTLKHLILMRPNGSDRLERANENKFLNTLNLILSSISGTPDASVVQNSLQKTVILRNM